MNLQELQAGDICVIVPIPRYHGQVVHESSSGDQEIQRPVVDLASLLTSLRPHPTMPPGNRSGHAEDLDILEERAKHGFSLLRVAASVDTFVDLCEGNDADGQAGGAECLEKIYSARVTGQIVDHPVGVDQVGHN